NVDAGTMNPTEHGEVFVLDDGMECDQDMGNYERFLGTNLTSKNYMTTGSVYLSVITKERNLGYKGKQVEVIPRIPLEVISRINKAAQSAKADIVVTEIGGTAGEYENILFLEAIRILKLKNPADVFLTLVSVLPPLGAGGTELKTKPTQHAVRALNAVGIHPDMVLARAKVPLDAKRKEKIQFMCSIDEGYAISAPDVENIYEVPLNFEKDNISDKILQRIKLRPRKKDLQDWRGFVSASKRAKIPVRIGIVGKYFDTGDFVLEDSYISVIEALKHAAYSLNRKPVIEWLNAEKLPNLSQYQGIIVPGGFGERGNEGKIRAINYARTKKLPFFGLCYGMQLAVVEFARSVAKLQRANSTEIDPRTSHPVIDILPEQKEIIEKSNYGATMRLGAWPANLKKGTVAHTAYSKEKISERHRHRYEVNPEYIERLVKKGLIFSGISPDRRLMEIAELPKSEHPFFVGTQFHPEFKSSPLAPHPLFREFIKAAIKQKQETRS
ncbi:MAG: CTP synthase, partial [Candidatus Colwellbacteria bacterium]|nr:CTP synthase [Candidatus Colwellbacteria bacterium]